jgi:hypothetical protein
MVLVTGVSIGLVIATVILHYEALRLVSGVIPRLAIPPRSRILVVLAAVFLAHVAEISLYAVVYYILQTHFGSGTLGGLVEGQGLDFFYFSIAMFTTLGTGDLVVSGPMRLIAGIESLNGLVLIGWSASFTYLSMEKFWEDHRRPHVPHHRRSSAPPPVAATAEDRAGAQASSEYPSRTSSG